MKNYKVTLAYDGSRYDGWQKQGNTENTIQGKIEALLFRITGEQVEICGAGRTDAGVHARGQVFHVKFETEISAEKLYREMNRYLPEDISVSRVEEASARFHSRLNSTGKVYEYRIHNSEAGNPFLRKYYYQMEEPLDLEAMKRTAGLLVGTWDYKGFCSLKNPKKSTVRTIYEITLERQAEDIVLTFYGNGFLYHMVRILTGTIIEAGLCKRRPESVKEILEKKDRALAGFTAPARGLCLCEVKFH